MHYFINWIEKTNKTDMLAKLPPLSTDHFPRHRCMSPRGPGPRSQWCECEGRRAEHSRGKYPDYSIYIQHQIFTWGI